MKAYAACVRAGQCTAADEPETTGWGSFCNGTRADRQDHPVDCVDWNQARAYCAWAERRLPSEAEWEYAARGTDRRTYPWGNGRPSPQLLNACGRECVAIVNRELDMGWSPMYDGSDGWESTAPVGSYPAGASPFGALDMAGNVWEWTEDWFGPYPTRAGANPRGPGAGQGRVVRGGGWGDTDAANVRAADRTWHDPSDRHMNVGFVARAGTEFSIFRLVLLSSSFRAWPACPTTVRILDGRAAPERT